MYCYYKYSVALPRGAVCLSAVCDCGIFLYCLQCVIVVFFFIMLTYFLMCIAENRIQSNLHKRATFWENNTVYYTQVAYQGSVRRYVV